MTTKKRKIAIMGFRAVGKSTVTIRFVKNVFIETYNPTVENVYNTVIEYKGEKFNTEIVDTAGQDEYSIFQRQYEIGIHGYILMYSVNSRYSFDMVKNINSKIMNALGEDYFPRVLVGNKVDLSSERVVSESEGAELAKEWKCGFFETSAKENQNLEAIFQSMLSAIQLIEEPEEPSSGCVSM